MSPSIEFYFDYASPWAFLANALLERRFEGVPITYVPIYLRGLESFANGMPYTADKLRYVAQDVARVARHERVEMKAPSNFPINGLYALRGALVAEAAGAFPAYHQALFNAAWRDDQDISKKNVVAEIAKGVGIVDFESRVDEPNLKEALKSQTERAVQRGLFGVPTFFVGEKLFWGQDRMDYARREYERMIAK